MLAQIRSRSTLRRGDTTDWGSSDFSDSFREPFTTRIALFGMAVCCSGLVIVASANEGGTTALAHQRKDGYNVTVLLNARREKHSDKDNDALLKAVDHALHSIKSNH